MAHGSTLESTKAHNLEVEERYVHHQLQKFRQQLARQHPRLQERRITVRPSKPDFKVNHGPLMQSLAQAARHIDNFYITPVEALSQAAQLCSQTKQVATRSLVRQLEAEPEADCEQSWLRGELKQRNGGGAAAAAAIGSIELDMEYRKFSKQVQLDESRAQLQQRCRTPSPLLTTEELFKPMRAAAERQMLHLRTVRQEEELQEQKKLQQLQQQQTGEQPEAPQLQRESSSCSNTSDGIDSVISDLAEEALYELQMEAVEQQQQQLDEAVAVAAPKHVQFQLPLKALEQQTPSPNADLFEPLLIRRIEVPKVVVQPKQPPPSTEQHKQEPEPESCSLSVSAELEVPHEKQRIIEQLFQARSNTEQSLMRKYFLKWIHYTSMEKIERGTGKTATDNRAQKINAFLDKIRQEKRRQRNNKQATATSPVPVLEKAAQKTLEQREEAIKMTKQFKNK